MYANYVSDSRARQRFSRHIWRRPCSEEHFGEFLGTFSISYPLANRKIRDRFTASQKSNPKATPFKFSNTGGELRRTTERFLVFLFLEFNQRASCFLVIARTRTKINSRLRSCAEWSECNLSWELWGKQCVGEPRRTPSTLHTTTDGN